VLNLLHRCQYQIKLNNLQWINNIVLFSPCCQPTFCFLQCNFHTWGLRARLFHNYSIQKVHSIFNFNSIITQSQWLKNIFYFLHPNSEHTFYPSTHTCIPLRTILLLQISQSKAMQEQHNKHTTNSLKTVLHVSRLSWVLKILLQFNSTLNSLHLTEITDFADIMNLNWLAVIHSMFSCTNNTVKYISPIFSTSPWGDT
jgi:hypothetical protein